MRTNLLILSFICLYSTAIGQNQTTKVNTSYLRPSITMLFAQPQNPNETVVVNKFRTLEIDNKFDNHTVAFPDIEMPDTLDLQKIKTYVESASNPIIAKWWGRDEKGNFNYSLVTERGLHTATDADAIISQNTNTDRLEMLGEQLIDKSYILLYEITELYNTEEYYNRLDAKNRNNKNYTPAKRTQEGYYCDFNVYVYKVVFNDSVANQFYSDYWVDSNNQDSLKVEAWENASFPVQMITSTKGTVSSTQPKDKQKNETYKSMKELLEDLPAKIQENTIFELGRKIDDFRLKVTVYDTYPITAKLGTKEDLYIDQRFYAYEIEEDQNGNQKANRMGVIRVKQISNNDGIATGETEPSIFYQVSGKRIYSGMFMDSRDDLGLILNAGLNTANNKATSGFYLGFDMQISRFIKKPGWYFGLDLSLGSFDNIDVGNIRVPSGTLIPNGLTSSGNTLNLSINISKEIYLLNTGNFYLRPTAGLGIQTYTFNKVGNYKIDSEDKDYQWSSYYFPACIGLGWNLMPSISLEFKPSVYILTPSLTNNKEKIEQVSTPNEDSWGFGSIDKVSTGLTNSFILRIRF